VSTPTLGRAPYNQNGLRVASSGSVTLAAWVDSRIRSVDVVASRVDVTGKPLDPTGIVLRHSAGLDDVFWDGTDFVVITNTVADYELVFIGVDGAVRRRISLPITQPYGGHTYQGADSRLLFLPYDGYSPLATIADLQGNILRSGGEDAGNTAAWPASNGTHFLVIRKGVGFVAEGMDRDGNVLSSIDPHLPAGFQPRALSGDGRGGYVLIGYLPAAGDLTLIHLDANGLEQGAPVALQTRDPLDPGGQATRVTMTSGGFAVTWTVVLSNSVSSTYLSRDGGPPVQVSSFNSFGSESAYDPDADLVFTAMRELYTWGDYDVWVQKGTAPRQPLTESASDQGAPQIAAGANGFLAAWSEWTPDGKLAFVRRFSVSGEPLGDPQIFSDTIVNYGPTVASSGDVYLVTDGGYARRMDARTGEWLDASPFILRDRAIASNGKDALALTLEDCGGSAHVCIAARHVGMTGEPLLFNPVPLPMYSDSQPLLASNGKDYLVVWAERNCGLGCPVYYSRIVAMRLGADGSFIDRTPIILTGYSGFIASPSVSWNGTTYLVTWQDRGLSGAFISSDGNVQQLGNLGDGTFAAAAGSNFLLFRRLVSDAGDEWDGKVLGESDWTPIVSRPNWNFGPPSVAANGGYVMLAYDRVSEEAGHVGRVFLDPRAFVSRKRAVH